MGEKFLKSNIDYFYRTSAMELKENYSFEISTERNIEIEEE